MNLRNVLVSQRYYLFISCTAFFSIILIQRNRITSWLLFIYLFIYLLGNLGGHILQLYNYIAFITARWLLKTISSRFIC